MNDYITANSITFFCQRWKAQSAAFSKLQDWAELGFGPMSSSSSALIPAAPDPAACPSAETTAPSGCEPPAAVASGAAGPEADVGPLLPAAAKSPGPSSATSVFASYAQKFTFMRIDTRMG